MSVSVCEEPFHFGHFQKLIEQNVNEPLLLILISIYCILILYENKEIFSMLDLVMKNNSLEMHRGRMRVVSGCTGACQAARARTSVAGDSGHQYLPS